MGEESALPLPLNPPPPHAGIPEYLADNMGEEPGPEGVGLGADAGMGVHEVLAGRSSSPPRTGGGGYPGRGGTHTGEGRRGSIGDWARGSTGGWGRGSTGG